MLLGADWLAATSTHAGDGWVREHGMRILQTEVQTEFGMKVIHWKPRRLVEGHTVFSVEEVKELGRKGCG